MHAVIPSLLLSAAALAAAEPTLEIWHGDVQRVGHLGDAQDDFNVMGRVEPWRELDTLSYTINGKGDFRLAFRAHRRLVRDGDFNADVPIGMLQPGGNTITVRALFFDGRRIEKTVTVMKETGARPLPVRIRWRDLKNPQDAGQMVDGQWAVEGGGLRTKQVGYDRVFLIGDRAWQDYEVRTTVTIHAIPKETSHLSGGNGLGIILRFAGHVTGGPRFFPSGQPKWGYQPFGAIGWLRWQPGKPDEPPARQFYHGHNDGRKDFGSYAVKIGETYAMRFACETLPDAPDGQGVTRYSFKLWRASEPEPEHWTWQQVQTSGTALRKGGAVLLAHHVDATFGDVEITRK